MIKKYQKANIFDVSTAQIVNGYFLPNGRFTPYPTNGIVCIPIEEGKTYDVYGIVRVSSSTAIRYGTFTSVPTTTETDSIRYGTFAQNETLTITANTNENYLLVMFCGDSDYSAYGSVQAALTANCTNLKVDTLQWVTTPYRKYGTETETFTTLPHEVIGDGQSNLTWSMDGNMQVNGTPTPQNPITPQETGEKTANLFSGIYDNGYIDNNTGAYVTPDSTTVSIIVPCEALTEYTIHQITESLTHRWRIAVYDNLPVNGSIGTVLINDSTLFQSTITTLSDSKYIVVYFAYNNITPPHADFMVNKGSTALPYEPYGYKIPISFDSNTYTFYLSEPIRKINDSVDSLVSSGTATYNIRKLVIRGEETGWSQDGTYGSNNRYRLYLPNVKNTGTYITDFYNSHFKVQEGYAANTSVIWYGGSQYVYMSVPSSDYPTLADFKTWLQQQYAAGKPVTVYYILATPTTETVTAPSIPTSGSPQSFDVDTTLKPSEVSLTWHGWHELSDTKYTT